MKREKEIPAELLAYLKRSRETHDKVFNRLDMFCTTPVRAVRMKILNKDGGDSFCTVIIPPVDVYTTDEAVLKKGYLKRDALSYFVANTRKVFPYGHIYTKSGYVCLGTIFVPSAVPERSATMPLETLFLHNDRNLSHGDSHLYISEDQAAEIDSVIRDNKIRLSEYGEMVITEPKRDIIARDEIWNLSADVTAQLPLPDALHVMSDIYNIVFKDEMNNNLKESEGSNE